MKKKLIIFAAIVVVAVVAFILFDVMSEVNADISQTVEKITIEAGGELITSPSAYISANTKVLSKATVDVSGVKTDTVGSYILEVKYRNRIFDVFVDVVDTTPPKISVKNNKLTIGVNTTFKLHELEDLKIEDISATESRLSNGTEAMHYDKLGTYKDTITVVDHYGNSSSLDIEIEVIDLNYPVISGVRNYTVYQGTPVDAKAGVTASDIEDGDLTAWIDISSYNVNQLGTQYITYRVKDVYGNETTATATLTVLKIPETTAAPAPMPR